MFEGFANVWTPLVLERRVGRRPLRVMLAGEALVLFRSADGRVGALIDRCPHRGAALSLGHLTEDGCLECPFHGWRFDADGANRGVPLNPDAKLASLGAAALPVRRIGELIWVYTSVGTAPPGEPTVPTGLSDPGLARCYVEREWDCHWTRAMENMLDSPHLPFVHRRTIGRVYRSRMKPDSRMDIAWEDTPWGGRARALLDGEDSGGVLEHHRPNVMTLHIPIRGRRFEIHALVIPAEPGRTRLIVAGSRDFARCRLFSPLFAWMNGRIADEDMAVVESSGPDECPPASQERSVASDRATLRFRKYYYDELRSSRT